MIGVAREDDARRIMEVLPKRMNKYGLTHPDKTTPWSGSLRPPWPTPNPRTGTPPAPGH